MKSIVNCCLTVHPKIIINSSCSKPEWV